ncbi:MAG: 8-amino-7-oxononanoate synthase [Acidobacteria bacterium]|nr:8-amino-7-oxononanoate synthase [Acidobacteriota bacterium]
MTALSALESRVRAHLRTLSERGLLRTLRPPSGLDLSSNDYLALSRHRAVKASMIDAVQRDGCGSTGSRLLGGHREAFDSVERAFAAFKGTERALYFSSGYLANLAVLTSFVEPGDTVLSDRLNHASLRDGIRLSLARRVVFPHNDAGALTRRIERASGQGQVFVVTESLFSMDGDRAPLSTYADICRQTGALLIVDEAHAVGIRGQHGSGLIEESGVGRDVLVSINSAGKALGVSGAFVAGPAWAIEHMTQQARPFLFSTAPPPAVADAIQTSLTIVTDEPERRERLRLRSAFLRKRLGDAGISTPGGDTPIVPVVIGGNHRAVEVAGALHAEGFDVRAVRPPTVPPGTARLRISVHVDIAEADLDRFANRLATLLTGQVPCPVASS